MLGNPIALFESMEQMGMMDMNLSPIGVVFWILWLTFMVAHVPSFCRFANSLLEG